MVFKSFVRLKDNLSDVLRCFLAIEDRVDLLAPEIGAKDIPDLFHLIIVLRSEFLWFDVFLRARYQSEIHDIGQHINVIVHERRQERNNHSVKFHVRKLIRAVRVIQPALPRLGISECIG